MQLSTHSKRPSFQLESEPLTGRPLGDARSYAKNMEVLAEIESGLNLDAKGEVSIYTQSRHTSLNASAGVSPRSKGSL